MGAGAAFREGVRRVNGAPAVVAGMAAVTLLVALPLSLALRGMIQAHLGRSLAAETAAGTANYPWWQEFMSSAGGLAATLTSSITGFGAVLENLGGLLDNLPLATTIADVTAAWMVIWTFLSGGVIDRLARGRRTRAQGFFAACGVHFWRLLRLGMVAWLVYAFLFGRVHGWIFDEAYSRLTADLTVERTAFALRVAGYLLFASLLVVFALIFDYARIRIVVEDRRSALGAIAASLRFLRRHPGRVVRLSGLNGLALLVLLSLYAAFAPTVPRDGLALWIALAFGQGYIIGRHYLKLVGYASSAALFQATMAHASYTAAPVTVWPDSPAAERIVNAESVGLR
ncbi:MAG TPA: hypothetical protein VM364_10700 [Vicinamibacterales bacterium]|nr:hypothetical protein [Vicinamibacterales bacterium]